MRFSITRRLAALAMVPAALLGIVSIATPANAAVTATAMVTLQNQIIGQTNKARAANGCPALRVDAKLVQAARGQSSFMANTGKPLANPLMGSPAHPTGRRNVRAPQPG